MDRIKSVGGIRAMRELQYGMLNNELVHISSVKSGLECNGICPFCKARLVARKGPKKAHHFAHFNSSDCNHGSETALHIMAKEIVAKSKKIWVPALPKDVYLDSRQGYVVTFDKAELEKQLSPAIRSDVLLTKDNRSLNIEIKVTHEINVLKQKELFNLGVATLEIDFSDMISSFSPELISKRLLKGTRTALVFSPKKKNIFAKRILGEIKSVYSDRYGKYVKNCPKNNLKCYLSIKSGEECGECHECYGFEEFRENKGMFLCRGVWGNLDFNEIEQIIELIKEENHLIYVKLLMKNGSVFEKQFRMRK